MASTDDPYDWDLSDVQNFFRNDATKYIADVPRGKLPDMEPFLAALEENQVEGYTLLNDLTSETLRDDCGVRVLGHRSMVMRCITKLRRESQRYLQERKRNEVPSTLTGALLDNPAAREPDSGIAPPEPSTQATAPPTSRQNETQVLDVQGRKRRKLVLNTVKPAGGYLQDSEMCIERLFFGGTPFGGQMPDTDLPSKHHANSEDNFQFFAQPGSIGAIHHVYRQMRHFLSNTDYLDLRRYGRPAVGILPYRESQSRGVRSAMVIQFPEAGDTPVALREEATKLDREDAPDTADAQEVEADNNGQWEHLLENHKAQEDDVLPVFGAEMDEHDPEAEAPEESIAGSDDESQAMEVAEADNITDERKIEIVEECIAKSIAEWQDKLPKREEKSKRKIWNQMKKSRMVRASLIASAQSEIDHLTKHLNTLKRELLKDTWFSESSLTAQCGMLEGTIENREMARWKISVWQQRQEPDRAAQVTRRRANVPPSSTAAKSLQSAKLIPLPEDRLSFSPASQPVQDQQEVEEIMYDADDDDEHFHTPGNSPPASASADIGAVDSADDFVVDTEDDHLNEANLTGADLNGADLNGADLTGDDQYSETDALTGAEAAPPPLDTGSKDDSYTPGSQLPDSEDELVTPSKLIKFRLHSSTPKAPVGSLRRRTSIIPSNLTESSPRKRGRPKKVLPLTGDAMDATPSEIDAWDFKKLARDKDRQRILLHLVRKTGGDVCRGLDDLLRKLGPTFKADLVESCKAFRSNEPLDLDHSDVLDHARELYIRWMFLDKDQDAVAALPDNDFEVLFDPVQAGLFSNMLRRCFTKRTLVSPSKPSPAQRSATKSTSSKIGSSSAPVIISSSDERPVDGLSAKHLTPHKKRKREVKIDASAKQRRGVAAERQRRFDESQTTDPARLLSMIGSDSAPVEIEINPVRDEDAVPIFIPQFIARRMKPHQIDGVRFLWREITATGEEEDDGAQGCMLAHTMGLGKTMQAITLLVTANECARSDNKEIRSQLPKHLRRRSMRDRYLRTLILCPASLMANWRREVGEWARGQLGDVYIIESGASKAMESNVRQLEDWKVHGGVVLVGTTIFTTMVAGKKSVKARTSTLAMDDESVRVQELLTQGPEIVVVDEVHKLKDERTGISKAARKLKTESRIGLTGTPLSNEVGEVFSLIDFIAPGFLGNHIEFKSHFAEPIVQGTFATSTSTEKRRSLVKLRVLHAEVQPKVHRATIEVLRGSLKPKTEYVITVPLSELQRELYKTTVNALVNKDKGEDEVSQFMFFGRLGVLSLITNHPNAFRHKLLQPPKKKKSKAGKDEVDMPRDKVDAHGDEDTEVLDPDDSNVPLTESGAATPFAVASPKDAESESDPHEQDVYTLGLSQQTINSILDSFDDDINPEISAKMSIFMTLLSYSLECGDKVLIFSSSILTLDYVGRLLDTRKRELGDFGRIDGRTTMPTRTRLIENFHKGDFDIMLISTKAGGVGLNIHAANRVFIMDFLFNPTHEEQAVGRAYRLGQTKPVFVYRFVAGGTFESNLYNMQMFKTSLAQRVVDKKNPRRNAERNAKDYFYEPREVPQEPLNAEFGNDPEVLDKLLLRHGDGLEEPGKIDTLIRAIKTMETLHEDAMDAPLDEQELKEVNEEIAMGKKRPRGKKALLSTMPPIAGMAGPSATQPVPRVSAALQPPASTFAGASMGGSPFAK
ncbi:uncharacterized protein LTR77_008498 [Saxophila tyrrhenica]|uniref:Uncharacterized protein n=1 Tax=Saxophila tyrrhenica TaxID=1690608 RepID=A0AAV9P141_9PEZI|nr:hypothetical protein LTR77_008498 [Saxophila tyrrhenica]